MLPAPTTKKVPMPPTSQVRVNNRGIFTFTHAMSANDMTGPHHIQCLTVPGNRLKPAGYNRKVCLVLDPRPLNDCGPARIAARPPSSE